MEQLNATEQLKELMENVRKMTNATQEIANVTREIANATVSTPETNPLTSIINNPLLIAGGALTAVITGCCLFRWWENRQRRHGTDGRFFPANRGSTQSDMELVQRNRSENVCVEPGSSRQATQGYQESEMSTQGKNDKPSTGPLLLELSPDEEKREAVNQLLGTDELAEQELIAIDKSLKDVGLM